MQFDRTCSTTAGGASGFAMALEWFVATRTKCRQIGWPAWTDVTRFNQDEARTRNCTIRAEFTEPIQVSGITPNGSTSTHPRILRLRTRCRAAFQNNLPNSQLREFALGSRIGFQNHIDHISEAVIEHEEIHDRRHSFRLRHWNRFRHRLRGTGSGSGASDRANPHRFVHRGSRGEFTNHGFFPRPTSVV